jgi:hypothetical protein
MIRPSYWTDVDLQTRMGADCREFYIGLWQESDDAGFVDWDIDRIGAELYPFRGLGTRRARMARWMDTLTATGHVVLLDCGKHLFIPTLSKHQAPPRPSYQNRKAHEACMRHMAPGGASWDHMAPAQEGQGREGGLDGGRRGAAMKETTLRDEMAARGLDVVP